MTNNSNGVEYILSYDHESYLVKAYNDTGDQTLTSVYDGDGKRVKASNGVTTTEYVGNYFEWNGSTSTMVKYYYASGQRIAMRVGTGSGNTGLTFLFSDQLGSVTVSTNNEYGVSQASAKYSAWGGTRSGGISVTNMHYTGQREEASLGLYFYNARWYDPALGRFTSPDSIIPPGVQGLS